jgi:hypothetical protein
LICEKSLKRARRRIEDGQISPLFEDPEPVADHEERGSTSPELVEIVVGMLGDDRGGPESRDQIAFQDREGIAQGVIVSDGRRVVDEGDQQRVGTDQASRAGGGGIREVEPAEDGILRDVNSLGDLDILIPVGKAAPVSRISAVINEHRVRGVVQGVDAGMRVAIAGDDEISLDKDD